MAAARLTLVYVLCKALTDSDNLFPYSCVDYRTFNGVFINCKCQ